MLGLINDPMIVFGIYKHKKKCGINNTPHFITTILYLG